MLGSQLRTPTVIPGAAPPRPRLGRGRRICSMFLWLYIQLQTHWPQKASSGKQVWLCQGNLVFRKHPKARGEHLGFSFCTMVGHVGAASLLWRHISKQLPSACHLKVSKVGSYYWITWIKPYYAINHEKYYSSKSCRLLVLAFFFVVESYEVRAL